MKTKTPKQRFFYRDADLTDFVGFHVGDDASLPAFLKNLHEGPRPAPQPPVPDEPDPIKVLERALESNNILTRAQIEAARDEERQRPSAAPTVERAR